MKVMINSQSIQKVIVFMRIMLVSLVISVPCMGMDNVEGIQMDQLEFIEKDGRKLVKIPLKLVLQLLVDRSSTIRSGLLDRAITESNLVSAQESRQPELTTSVSSSQSNYISDSDLNEDDATSPYLTYYETDSQTLSSSVTKTDFNGIRYSMTLRNTTSQSTLYSIEDEGSESEDLGTTDDPVNSTSVTFGVEVPIFQDWGEVNEIEIHKQQIQAELSNITLKSTRLQLIEQAAKQYWEIVGLWQNKASLTKAVEVAESLLEENQEKVELGLMTPVDAKESRIQLLRNRQRWLANNKQILQAEDNLKVLLDLEAFPYGFYPGDGPCVKEVMQSDQVLLEKFYENSLDLSAIKKSQESNQWDIKQAQNKEKTDLDLSISYTLAGGGKSVASSTSGLGDQNLSGYDVALTWRVPLFDRQAEEELNRRRLEREKLQIQLNDEKASLKTDLKTIHRDLSYHRENILSKQAQYDLSVEVLDEEIKKLHLGRGRVYNVSEAQQNMIEAMESLIDATIDYEVTYLSLLIKTGEVYKAYQLDREPTNP
ncbi:TolC family protein [bacterium]|nr:TolC family protein [bacterium]